MKVSVKERLISKIRKGFNGIRNFIEDETGMGTVEVILIIVVLVGLVIIFKNQITGIVNTLFSKISSQTSTI